MRKTITKYVVFWDRTDCSGTGFAGVEYFIRLDRLPGKIEFHTFNNVEKAERFIGKIKRRTQTGKGSVMLLEDAHLMLAEQKLRDAMVP